MKNFGLVFKLSIFLCLTLFCQIISADQQAMSPVDMVELKRLKSPKLSPDGVYLLYLYSITDWDKNDTFSRYKMLDIKTGQEYPLSFPGIADDEDFKSPYWRPDGAGFLTVLEIKCAKNNDVKNDKTEDSGQKCNSEDAVDENDQAFFYDIKTNNFSRLTSHHSDIQNVEWAPDSSGFYFLAQKQKDPVISELLDKKFLIKEYEERDAKEVLFFDLENMQSKVVISGDYYVRSYALSRDGKKIIHMRAMGGLNDDRHLGELWLSDIETGTEQQLTDNNFSESRAKLSPDNLRFAYIRSINSSSNTYYESNVFIQKLGDLQPKPILPKVDIEMLAFSWGSDNEDLFILGNTGLRTNIYRYNISSSELIQLTSGDHEIRSWAYNAKLDSHSMIAATQDNPGEVYLFDGNTEEFKKISNEYADFNQRFKLPKQSAYTWKGRGRKIIEGLLVYPLDYVQGKKYPLVTITHGGPRQSVKFGTWRYSRYLPVLAAQGYLVLLPNHRGSTGYGDKFMRDMVGAYFNNAHHDVLDGIDALVKDGLADPDRLIKMGWSAGGHMTTKLITLTNRFKAASSGAGASDWASMYAETDVRASRTSWFGHAPWDKNVSHSKYLQQSSLKDSWKVKTPTLFFVGERDVRVPPTQSIMMYRGIKAAGADTRLYVAPKQPHGFKLPSYQLFKINTELNWYAKYALQKEYTYVLPDTIQ